MTDSTVHVHSCCVHQCKLGDENCPVMLGTEQQLHRNEECSFCMEPPAKLSLADYTILSACLGVVIIRPDLCKEVEENCERMGSPIPDLGTAIIELVNARLWRHYNYFNKKEQE